MATLIPALLAIADFADRVNETAIANYCRETADSWNKRLGLDGQPVVTYVGTMALASHPIDLLLEAFAKLCTHVPKALLLLVGGGPDLVKLRSMAQQLGILTQCRFTGRVAPNEVPPLDGSSGRRLMCRQGSMASTPCCPAGIRVCEFTQVHPAFGQ